MMQKFLKEKNQWLLLVAISIFGLFLIFLTKQNNDLMENYSNKDFAVRQTQRTAGQIRAQLFRAAYYCQSFKMTSDPAKKENNKDQCLGAIEAGLGQMNTQNPFEKALNVQADLDKLYALAEADEIISEEFTQKMFEDLGAEESHQWQSSTRDYLLLKNNFSKTNLLFSLSAVFILLISAVSSVLILRKEKSDRALSKANEEIELQKAQLVQSAKMSALGEMASGIAHEINNPMTVIDGKAASSIKLLEKPELDKPRIIQNLEKIISMSERIGKIVKGLRSFSRDGSKDPFLTSNVYSLMEETFELCQAKFKNRNIRLQNSFTDKELTLNCRSVEISQVLLNLIHNAADAIISTSNKDDTKAPLWIQIDVLVSEKWLEFRVTDSGNGIPLGVQQKLFQPFYTTKELGKGTGLGLSISRGIVSSHKGSMGIDNECSNTRFYFKIPRDLPAYTNNAEESSNLESAIIKDNESPNRDLNKDSDHGNKKSVA